MKTKIDTATRSIIDAAVRAHSGGLKVKSIDIRPTFDDDEFEGLEIDVYYAAPEQVLEWRERMRMETAIGDALFEVGDRRIPYVEHHFAQDKVT